ncbi:MAG: hypothetical protein AAF613_03640 [Pseudomonadota bacterium]
MRRIIFPKLMAAGLVVLASACASAPAYDPVQFTALLNEVRAEPNPVIAASTLTRTLETASLDSAQRAQLHFERGQVRWAGAVDKPAAISDFKTYLALQPAGAEAQTATDNMDLIAEEIDAHRERLTGLQNQSDWFDDMTALGDIAKAAARYQASGLTPTHAQADLLRGAGLICKPPSGRQPLYPLRAGSNRPEGEAWCLTAPDS